MPTLPSLIPGNADGRAVSVPIIEAQTISGVIEVCNTVFQLCHLSSYHHLRPQRRLMFSLLHLMYRSSPKSQKLANPVPVRLVITRHHFGCAECFYLCRSFI